MLKNQVLIIVSTKDIVKMWTQKCIYQKFRLSAWCTFLNKQTLTCLINSKYNGTTQVHIIVYSVQTVITTY